MAAQGAVSALAVLLGALMLRFAGGAPGKLTIGGPVELQPWPEDAANLVKNPSFEELDGGGWVVGWDRGEPAHHVAVTGVARSGQRSAALSESHRARYYPAMSQTLALSPGWYSVRGWMKAEQAGTNDPYAGGRISVAWGTASQGKGAVTTDLARGTTGWTQVGIQSFPVLPGESVTLRLEAYRKPDGRVFFDDLEVHRLVPPVVEGFLLHPNYRGILFEDGPQAIRLSLKVRPEELRARLADLTVRLSLWREGTAVPAASVDEAPSASSLMMTLDAGALPPGAYVLKLQALHRLGGGVRFESAPYRIVKHLAGARRALGTYVDHDNVLVLSGRRAFALGVYDTGGYYNVAEGYEPRISELAQAPINLYLNYWLGGAPIRSLDALMEALQGHGMGYLHTVNLWYRDDPNWPGLAACGGRTADSLGPAGFTACMAAALTRNRGLAGWYTADERAAEQAGRVFGQYRILREHAPGGVTFIAQNSVRELSRWRDVADVIGVDPYPIFNIPEGSLSPFEMVTDWVEQAQAAVERSRPVWGVIQYFPFGSKGHWPTYAELRTMSFMAIAAGAKGLFYWSYGAQGLAWVEDPREKKELWQRLVRVTKEIKSLEPALLAPDTPGILAAPPPAAIRVLAKRLGETRYLIAVNNTPAPVDATFTLSEPVGAVGVPEENREVAPSGPRTYADLFAAYATHVYRIDRPTPR